MNNNKKESRKPGNLEKWWLISDEDALIIKEGLLLISRISQKALHALESGLHETNNIPDDWKKGADKNV